MRSDAANEHSPTRAQELDYLILPNRRRSSQKRVACSRDQPTAWLSRMHVLYLPSRQTVLVIPVGPLATPVRLHSSAEVGLHNPTEIETAIPHAAMVLITPSLFNK